MCPLHLFLPVGDVDGFAAQSVVAEVADTEGGHKAEQFDVRCFAALRGDARIGAVGAGREGDFAPDHLYGVVARGDHEAGAGFVPPVAVRGEGQGDGGGGGALVFGKGDFFEDITTAPMCRTPALSGAVSSYFPKAWTGVLSNIGNFRACAVKVSRAAAVMSSIFSWIVLESV